MPAFRGGRHWPTVARSHMLSRRHIVYQATPGRHYLVLDCGAGADLAGEVTLLNYQRDCLDALGEQISYAENYHEFSGISQNPLSAPFEAWAPTFPGGIGSVWYRCHSLDGSFLPMLLSTPSVVDNTWHETNRHPGNHKQSRPNGPSFPRSQHNNSCHPLHGPPRVADAMGCPKIHRYLARF